MIRTFARYTVVYAAGGLHSSKYLAIFENYVFDNLYSVDGDDGQKLCVFQGRIYHIDKAGYFRSIEKSRAFFLHHEVWKYFSDQYRVPKGCVIHHKNMDKSDNRYENLVCMSSSAHGQLHSDGRTPDHSPRNLKCKYCGNVFVTRSNGKFCSRRCSDRYRDENSLPKTCPVCGESFRRYNKHTRYCSKSCASKVTYENCGHPHWR